MGQFGGKVTESEISKYATSEHWDGEKFNNLEETNMDISFWAIPRLLFNQLFKRKSREPKQLIPHLPIDKDEFTAHSETSKFIWYGHSTLLINSKGKTILIDPMLGPDAAPIAPFNLKRYNTVSTDIISELPEIDLLIMSHDHYDHLDFKSIQALKGKVKKYYVALGVGRHLISWGIAPELITEFDWWQTESLDDLQITFTPSRHFSGRGIKDRFKGLWGGWVIKSATENIWFSGDGGYGDHFKEIGERLGPFDIGFMECGQYNKLWESIHMYPHQSVQAGIDAKAKKIMPVHWGSFTLSDHFWKEPVAKFVEACKEENIPYLVPKIGEIVTDSTENTHWWENVD